MERKRESLRTRYVSCNSPRTSAFSHKNNLIVAYLGSSVKDYQQNFFHNISEQDWPCPTCGGYLRHHGYYGRITITDDGAEHLSIFRGRCPICKRTHAILPDFIAPYRHYAMLVISHDVEEMIEMNVPAERVSGPEDVSTAKRWKRRFMTAYNEATGHLNSLAFQITRRVPSLVEFYPSSPWQRVKESLESLPPILSTSILGAGNTWLTRQTNALLL